MTDAAASAAARVRERALAAADWATLRARAAACTACPELAATRRTVVVGQAPPGARVLLLGEAPGAQEDMRGEPFVGRSGQLLDSVLADVGLARAEVAVVNVVKCRPPDNRRPTRAEAATCRGWLDRQLDLVAPAVVVALGATAVAAVLGRQPSLAAARAAGPHVVGVRLVIATYHPSAALRWGPRGAPLAALAADLGLARALADGLPG